MKGTTNESEINSLNPEIVFNINNLYKFNLFLDEINLHKF